MAIVVYFVLSIIFILGAFRAYAEYTNNKILNKKNYTFRDRFKVSRQEYDEANKLLTRPFCDNEYCKIETIVLFIEIKRHLLSDQSWENSYKFKEDIFQFCKKVTLKELKYIDPVGGIGLDLEEEDIPIVIKEIIKERGGAIIRKLTGETDRTVYNWGDAWEVRYYNLTKNFNQKHVQQFYEDICQLATMSDKRITVEREIYYKAHRFLIHKDKEYSLKLYLHYLNVKTISDTFKYRKLGKNYQDWFFKNKKEEEDFTKICTKLLQSKNLEAALKQFDKLEISERKKIRLNISAIKDAAGKHAKVAGILSDILSDEPETIIQAKEEQKAVYSPTIPAGTSFIDTKEALLQLFITHHYKLNKEEVDIFARSHGVLKSQLIESINEKYYEELDDVLIDENDEYYNMDKAYYEQIKNETEH